MSILKNRTMFFCFLLQLYYDCYVLLSCLNIFIQHIDQMAEWIERLPLPRYEAFLEEFEVAWEKTTLSNTLVLLGNFNAHVGIDNAT